MNLRKTAMTIVVAVFVLPLLFLASIAYAQSTPEWRVDSFEASYILSDELNGAMDINEIIDVTFIDQRRGIFRDIPTLYDQGVLEPDVNLKVDVRAVTDGDSGAPRPYDESRSNDNVRLKIGDPDKYVVGEENYTIDYGVQNAVRFFDTQDELFWDINGTDWSVAMGAVSATLRLPEAARAKVIDTGCFTGGSGSTDKNCTIEYDEKTGVVAVASNSSLNNFENLSFVVAFEKGVFIPPSFLEKWGSFILQNIGILLPIGAIFFSYRYWDKHGRDPKSRGVIVPEYTPPEGLTAGEMGTVADYSVDSADISATIIDLAIRGYIRIEDTTKKERTKKRQYVFHLLRDDLSQLKEFERMIINGLFSEMRVGSSVKMSSLKEKFYKTTEKVSKELYVSLVNTGYFAAHPETTRNLWLGAGGFMLAAGLFSVAFTQAQFLGWSLGIALSGVVVMIFGWFMPKRTEKGAETKAYAEGMKMYMELAEKDRLKVMQGADSRYIGDTTSEVFTVELFEKLLPYAIVMGVEKSWAKQFKDIYSEPPGWYSGNWNTFSTIYLVNSLSNGVNTMNTALASKPSSSSGSGFSGGGFSGGGFGGGGGGSW